MSKFSHAVTSTGAEFQSNCLRYVMPLFVAACLAMAAGCGNQRTPPNASETKDIAAWFPGAQTNVDGIYYYESGNFMRAACPANTALFDRAICNKQIADVPAGLVTEAYRKFLAKDLPGWDDKAGQLRTRLERIERRQIELVNLQPTPRDPNLKVDIANKEEERAGIDATIADLQDQIARVEADLRHGADADLIKQLGLLREQVVAAMATQTSINQELSALRQRYLRANADLIDPSLFRELDAERTQVVRDLDNAIGQRKFNLEKMLSGDRLLARIMDSGYVYDFTVNNPVTVELSKVLSPFVEEFSRQDLASRTFQAVVDTANKVVTVDVGRTGFIGKFYCMLTTVQAARCDTMELTAPDGTVTKTVVGGSTSGIRLKYPEVCDGEFCNAFKKEVRGRWSIKPICQMIMIGSSPLRGVNEGWNCNIETRRWTEQ